MTAIVSPADIAVIGLGCRFPGARDLQAYWELLLAAERQFAAVPAERWNHAPFHTPGRRTASAAYTDQVAFLDDVDRFAALHYGLPPARVKAMDPQHRLMLDVTREALDDAGWGRGGFDKDNTGVFVGMSVSDYKDLLSARIRALTLAEGPPGPPPDCPGSGARAVAALSGDAAAAGHACAAEARRTRTRASDARAADAVRQWARQLCEIRAFTLPGSLLNMAPATISRQYGLGGPSFAVDAACSGSLIALETAVSHLRRNTCRIAVVGGVYISLTPDGLIGFSQLGALSATGVCRPFDRRADGFVLGEGAASAVLRPLADALAAGDRIYAVIKGIGSANDGACPGPLAPTAEGQLRAMRRAYHDAGVAPSSMGYIEAHGTATRAGDRAEVEALRRLRTEFPDDDPGLCYLGSAKALIGHALAASGLAGLVKAALAVHRRTVPPQPDVTPHPDLAVGTAGLRFADTVRPWPQGAEPVRAAVSSFGFGGTNVHAILEEAPAPAPSPAPVGRAHAQHAAAPAGPDVPRRLQRPERAPHLVLVSAGSPRLLDAHIGELLDVLDRAPGTPLAALAHTLGCREPLTSRLAVTATSLDEYVRRLRLARRRLAEGARGDLGDGAFAADAPLPPDRRRVAFVFPGQGSQRLALMHDLYRRFAPFRSAFDELARVAREHTHLDPAEVLYGPRATAQPDDAELRRRLAATEVCQPLLGTVQIAATRLLAACGIRPDVVLGHSAGEFAAAAAADVLTGEDTVRLLANRGAVLARTESGRRGQAGSAGGMLALHADKATFRQLADGVDDVWLACFNHPRHVVVSGTLEGLATLERACAAAKVATRRLEVSGAFHSPRVAGAEKAIRSDLARRDLARPSVAFVSCVNGALCTEPTELRELWARHASAPVRFEDAVRSAHAHGARVFVQVTGHRSLLSCVRRTLTGHDDVHLVSADGPAPDNGHTFLDALARLAVLGAGTDPRALVPRDERRLLDLPVARLETRSYWIRGTRRPSARTEASFPVDSGVPEESTVPEDIPEESAVTASDAASVSDAAPENSAVPVGAAADAGVVDHATRPDGEQQQTDVRDLLTEALALLREQAVTLTRLETALDAYAATRPAPAAEPPVPRGTGPSDGADGSTSPAVAEVVTLPAARCELPDAAGAEETCSAPRDITEAVEAAGDIEATEGEGAAEATEGAGAAETDEAAAVAEAVEATTATGTVEATAAAGTVEGATATAGTVEGATATAGTVEGATAAGTVEAAAAAEIAGTVYAHVARISAFPVGHLRADQRLVEDLGFDSLMLTDLFTALARQWPRLSADEKRHDLPTVAALISMITERAGGTEVCTSAATPPASGPAAIPAIPAGDAPGAARPARPSPGQEAPGVLTVVPAPETEPTVDGSHDTGARPEVDGHSVTDAEPRAHISHNVTDAEPGTDISHNGSDTERRAHISHHVADTEPGTDGSHDGTGPERPPARADATDPAADGRGGRQSRIDRFPEVAAHGARVAAFTQAGLPNPYFLVHDGGMTDTTVVEGRELLSFSSYNYLGLATHPHVREAAAQAIERHGTSVSASRLLSGNRRLHLDLETELASALGCEAALTLVSGHAANVTLIGHLVGEGDLVVHDALAHDSVLQGCRLSGATRRPFPHNDAAALDALLAEVRPHHRRVLVVVEGVYSMDGDIADLPALIEVKRRHGALLMIDEAHSIGVLGEHGRGIGEHFGTAPDAVDLWSGTLSKALASCGGYVAASRTVVEYLRYTVPGFVFSAGMTPANTAAALAALRVLRAEPERVARLASNARLFLRLARQGGVDTGDSRGTPVVPCIVGGSTKTLRVADLLFRRGISVNPILYPAVPEQESRLRFFVTCDHTPEQIYHAVSTLVAVLREADVTGTAAA
ncbi:aminotransferase class I/II-fold pyridoxal phosphate-dependent enzyme [Streptomyces sp. Tue6028]|uniref:aminotransferase class I/II-fold pyridoxal phosphate-dependent enzyme n=1 Tax=Streptomyces sp. Tue6028 TaxID=2036037 RepID=UPI003D7040BD